MACLWRWFGGELPNVFDRFSKYVRLATFSSDLDTVYVTAIVQLVIIALVILVQNAKSWNGSLEILDASIQIGTVSAFNGCMACLRTARHDSVYDMGLGALDGMCRRRERRERKGLLHWQVRLEGNRQRYIGLRRDSIWCCVAVQRTDSMEMR